jgi:hypothetical protein
MELAKRDMTIQILRDEIECKKKFLIHKVNELYGIEKYNEFLGEIVDDYSKYKKHILKEKQEQYEALRLISNYINNLKKSIDIADHELNESKYHQKTLVGEMNRLKKEIDTLLE